MKQFGTGFDYLGNVLSHIAARIWGGAKSFPTWLAVAAVLVVSTFVLGRGPLSAAESPAAETVNLEVVSALAIDPLKPDAGQSVRASFSIRNAGSSAVHLKRIAAGGRGPGCADWACNKFKDFPFRHDVTIQPGATFSYSEEQLYSEEGSYFTQIAYELTPDAWYFLGERLDFNVSPGLQVMEELDLSPDQPISSDLVFADFVLFNAGSATQSFQKVGVAARGPGCEDFSPYCPNVDFVYSEDVSLKSGESFPFQGSRIFAEPGTYIAQIAVEDEAGRWFHMGAVEQFSVTKGVDVPRTSGWRFGVHFHPQWNEEDGERLKLARSVGVEVVRIGASWNLMERESKGAWDYDWYVPALEERIRQANALGIDVYLLLNQVPCWASSDPQKKCAADKWDDAYPPEDFSDYADAYRKLVELYGDRVSVWEVWNEPNSDRFWKPAPDAAEYTRLLKRTYMSIKAQDGEATVLGASLAGADSAFLNDMYEAGARGYFDALSLHPYSGGAPDDCSFGQWTYKCGVEGIRSMMLHHDDAREIWITEFGWSSYHLEPGVGEETQKEYLEESLEIVEYWEYVPVVTWYNLIDSDFDIAGLEHEDYMGLFDRSYRSKPAAKWLRDNIYSSEVFMPFIRR